MRRPVRRFRRQSPPAQKAFTETPAQGVQTSTPAPATDGAEARAAEESDIVRARRLAHRPNAAGSGERGGFTLGEPERRTPSPIRYPIVSGAAGRLQRDDTDSEDNSEEDVEDEARRLTLFFNGSNHFDLLVPTADPSDVTMRPNEHYRVVRAVGDGACLFNAATKSPEVRKALARILGGDPNTLTVAEIRRVIARELRNRTYRDRVIRAIRDIATALRQNARGGRREVVGAPKALLDKIRRIDPETEEEAIEAYGELVDDYIDAVEFEQQLYGGTLEISALSNAIVLPVEVIQPGQGRDGQQRWLGMEFRPDSTDTPTRESTNTTQNEFVPFSGTGRSTSGKTTGQPLPPKRQDGADPDAFIPFFGKGHRLSDKTLSKEENRRRQLAAYARFAGEDEPFPEPPSRSPSSTTPGRSTPRRTGPRTMTLQDLAGRGLDRQQPPFRVFAPPGRRYVPSTPDTATSTSGSSSGRTTRRDGYTVIAPRGRTLVEPEPSRGDPQTRNGYSVIVPRGRELAPREQKPSPSSGGTTRRDGYTVLVPPGRELAEEDPRSPSPPDPSRGLRRDGYTVFPPKGWTSGSSTSEQESTKPKLPTLALPGVEPPDDPPSGPSPVVNNSSGVSSSGSGGGGGVGMRGNDPSSQTTTLVVPQDPTEAPLSLTTLSFDRTSGR
ncbi:MAG: OTU domain-containing protein [Acidobacteriota bacterium]